MLGVKLGSRKASDAGLRFQTLSLVVGFRVCLGS